MIENPHKRKLDDELEAARLVATAAQMSDMMKHRHEKPTPDEVERARAENEKLEKIAKSVSEEERKRLLHKAIHTKHRYYAKHEDGTVHECAQHPHLRCHMIVRHPDGKVTHEYYAAMELTAKGIRSHTRAGRSVSVAPMKAIGEVYAPE